MGFNLRRIAVSLVALFAWTAGEGRASSHPTLVKISAGTGFFVNAGGDMVTNAHVVRRCQSITVHTDTGDHAATIQALDSSRDLAVLRLGITPPSIARFTAQLQSVRVGDAVTIIGYPGAEGLQDRPTYRRTTITALRGPAGEANWIQLATVAEHGNSGGPVLNARNEVVAVISGKAKTYRVDANTGEEHAPTLIGESDVAIPLPLLREFLSRNAIAYPPADADEAATGGDGQNLNENQSFVAPVRCIQGVVAPIPADAQ